MSAEKSLLQRKLDDSSSDGDNYFFLSAAQTVQTYSSVPRRYGGSIPGYTVIYPHREGRHQRMFRDYLADDVVGSSAFTCDLF